REPAALVHRFDRTKLALDHHEGREHEHEPEDDPGHDQQDEADADGKREQDRGAEIFPEGRRVPQQGKIGRIGIVVRGEIERRGPHADQRAEREIDHRADDRRVIGGTGQRGIDAAGETIANGRGEQDEEGRSDEEPRPPLERLPPKAYGLARRELHAGHDSTCPDSRRLTAWISTVVSGKLWPAEKRLSSPCRIAVAKFPGSGFHLAMPISLSLPWA